MSHPVMDSNPPPQDSTFPPGQHLHPSQDITSPPASQQAGGTHPTGMLSFFHLLLKEYKLKPMGLLFGSTVALDLKSHI